MVREHYFIATRKQWRCKDCKHTFSVTSGTIFAFHKLSLKMYLAAIAIYTNAVKGISALQMGRDLDVQYKTAFVLTHKIRESLMAQRDESPLSGEIHMDGAYVNGHVRPANKKEDRVDRRLVVNQRPNKRCVFVMRQKVNVIGDAIKGANKTIVIRDQGREPGRCEQAGRSLRHEKGSVICADESTCL
jgi:transposase-like protein